MSRIRINTAEVMASSASANAARSAVSSAVSMLSGVRGGTNPAVLNRNGIAERLANVQNELSQIEWEIQRISRTVESGAEQYEQTEGRIVAMGQSLGSVYAQPTQSENYGKYEALFSTGKTEHVVETENPDSMEIEKNLADIMEQIFKELSPLTGDLKELFGERRQEFIDGVEERRKQGMNIGEAIKQTFFAYEPKYIEDETALLFFDACAAIDLIPEWVSARHRMENEKVWEEEEKEKETQKEGEEQKKNKYCGSKKEGCENYIEHQGLMTDLKYGCWAASGNACEVIAVYNAEVYFNGGQPPEQTTFPELLQNFERKGIALVGALGTSPNALNGYLCENGYDTVMLAGHSINSQSLKKLEQNYEAYIVTVYNDKANLGKEVHTMCITKSEEDDGEKIYVLHNDFSKADEETGDGENKKAAGMTKGDTIEELLKEYKSGKAETISIIGIRQ